MSDDRPKCDSISLEEATLLVRPCEEPETEHEHRWAEPSHGLPHDGGVRSTHTHMKKFRPDTKQERL